MSASDKEIWKQIAYLKGHTTKNYAVSTHGRLASFTDSIDRKQILKTHLNGGYPLISVLYDGKSKSVFVHQAMGSVFLKKTGTQTHIIHLDYNKQNNRFSNLKWVSKRQQTEHTKNSPFVVKARAKKVYNGATAKKLDEKKVIRLKKEIWNPERTITLKNLANKYGIAEMNLYRIKNGEMWFHIHVDGEPMHEKYRQHLKNLAYREKQPPIKLQTKKPVKKANKR